MQTIVGSHEPPPTTPRTHMGPERGKEERGFAKHSESTAAVLGGPGSVGQHQESPSCCLQGKEGRLRWYFLGSWAPLPGATQPACAPRALPYGEGKGHQVTGAGGTLSHSHRGTVVEENPTVSDSAWPRQDKVH